ncbi:hypothetical protein E4T44_12592 [Aureobasidium sp. EXF-8845]|nr:hypothetical protein E4T44_12592 [Aureobasidium sp. EXF-8845]
MDYISEHDLEVFENQEFEKDIKEEETRQKERLAAKAQQRLRQNRSVSSSDRDGSVSGTSHSGSDGKNTRTTTGGRQRPTYTQFYPKQRAARGSLKQPVSVRNGADHRDSKRRRVREDRSMSSAQDAESIYSMGSPNPPQTQPPSAMEQAAGLLSDTHESDPMELDDETDNDVSISIRQLTGPAIKAATSAVFTFREHAAPKSSQPLSAKDKLVASLTAQQAAATSTMPSASNSLNPSSNNNNNNNATRQAVVDLNESSESEQDSDNSEVYTVEKIITHNKSDPSSHNKSVHGEKPVMLYLVKWEGYDDTTWEPATSFQDDDVLQEYWAQQAQKQKQKQKPLASSSKNTAILKDQKK